MYLLLMYTFAYLGAAVIGAISAAAVYAMSWLLNRYVGTRVEVTFGLSGLIGLALALTGQVLDNRILLSPRWLMEKGRLQSQVC